VAEEQIQKIDNDQRQWTVQQTISANKTQRLADTSTSGDASKILLENH
jgi:hypothetical protein